MNNLIHLVSSDLNTPIFSAGIARESNIPQYIVWQIISDVPGKTIGYSSNISKIRVQFDIYSIREEDVFDISSRLEKAMFGKGLVLLRNGPFFNTDTKMYRRTIDMSFLKKGNKYE